MRYVSDDQPGYTRKRKGESFQYFDTEGKLIRDETRLLRIRRLAIPPAYTDIWICPSPNGHIQATGRDDRRRKQYRYHERWRVVRDENKYDRMLVFGDALPKIRKRVRGDLALKGCRETRFSRLSCNCSSAPLFVLAMKNMLGRTNLLALLQCGTAMLK